VEYAPTDSNIDPSEANFVSLSAARMDFDLVSETNARDDTAPILDAADTFDFGGIGVCPFLPRLLELKNRS